MQECPRCKSGDIHRSRAKSKWEHWRREITGKRPFRCPACGWRGWGVDIGQKFDEHDAELARCALAPEPPNLTSTVLARDDQPPEPLRLEQLDVLAPLLAGRSRDRDPE